MSQVYNLAFKMKYEVLNGSKIYFNRHTVQILPIIPIFCTFKDILDIWPFILYINFTNVIVTVDSFICMKTNVRRLRKTYIFLFVVLPKSAYKSIENLVFIKHFNR